MDYIDRYKEGITCKGIDTGTVLEYALLNTLE